MRRTYAPIANFRWICGSLLALLLTAMPAAAAAPQGTVAEIENTGGKLVFYPVVEHDRIILTVTGPCNYEYREVIKRGDVGIFRLSEETIDAPYTFQLVAIPEVNPEIVDVLKQARKYDDYREVNALCRQGELPGAPLTQAAGFTIFRGEILYDPGSIEDRAPAPEGSPAVGSGGGDATGGIPLKDFVINDDLIVDGSACIGFDCVDGESFGFDTIRVKENNLRIKFDDTSTAASYPRNDWQLTANDSANGGASKFSIDDISGNRTPFTVEANARSHSLYVDDGGRIGSRTSTPSTEIHTIDGDTPTLRLQQDGSSGFAPQTWDVAGNETNFFIRDVTNGSQLPFRIRPDAPTSSIFIDVDGDVGLGTSSPGTLSDAGSTQASMHIMRTDGDASLLIEETNGTTESRLMMELVNNGDLFYRMTNSDSSQSVDLNLVGDEFRINFGTGGGGPELTLDNNGDLTITGTYAPDYVFEPDYELMPIDQLAEFIAREKHLPNVITDAEIKARGRYSVGEFQMRLLEKVEELTLYTLQQQETIDALQERLSSMDAAQQSE